MERERKRPSDPHPRVAIPAMALFAFVLASAFLLVGSGDCDSDAASYGSGTEPYGGLYADWSELTDGADYYVVAGGEVLITFEGRSIDGVTCTGCTNLSIQPRESSIYGILTSDATISLEEKKVRFVAIQIVYSSDLPIYGDVVNRGTLNDPLTSVDGRSLTLALYSPYFVKPGSEIEFKSGSGSTYYGEYVASKVTEGYGLSVNDDGGISGKLTKEGIVYIVIQEKDKDGTVINEYRNQIVSTNGGTSVSSISIEGSDSVKKGTTIRLHANVSPSNATFKDVYWSVSGGSHAGYYVDSKGDLILIGVSEGDVTVEAEAKDGSKETASKKITIDDADTGVETLDIRDFSNDGKESVILDSGIGLVVIKGYYAMVTSMQDTTIYVGNPPEGVGRIVGGVTDYNYVFIPQSNEVELRWVKITGAVNNCKTGTFTIAKESVITFDANGGSVGGQSTKTVTTTGSLNLPTATKDGSKFSGWYDAKEGGNFIGLAGSEYTPSGDITLYAHWDVPGLQITSDLIWVGGNGSTLSYTPKVTNSLTGEEITDFKVEIPKAKDQTGCLRADGSRVYGMMKDLIPGSYTAEVIVSKTGFESASQTITVRMPVQTLEPIDADTVVGQKWTIILTMKPDDAYIESYVVKFNDKTATSAQYDAGKSGNRGFYITCKSEGIYTIELTLSASGIDSSVKTITLNAKQAEEHADPPVIKSVKVTRYMGASDDNPAEPNTYYFSAIGAANYDVLIWDFGDGDSFETTELEQIHRYAVPGAYTVKCTVKNVTTGESAEASVNLETLDEPSVDASDIINIGSKYTSKIIRSTYSNLTLEVRCDGKTLDCFKLNRSTLSDGSFVYTVTGVCNEIGLVGKEVTFLLSSGSTPVETWKATVYAQSDTDDVKIEASAKYKADGLVVTLTDIVPNKSSMRLMVDWGDGSNLSRDAASAEFTHEYSSKGKYSVSLVWTWTSSDGTPSQREFTVNVDLSSFEGPSIVYHANGGQGTMDAQTGSKKYTIQECKFVREGMTCKYWNTSPDLKGTTYKAGDEVSPEGKLDLYAVWVPEESEDSNDVIRYAACALLIGIAALILIRRYVL